MYTTGTVAEVPATPTYKPEGGFAQWRLCVAASYPYISYPQLLSADGSSRVNKRSMDLGSLLDNGSRYDKCQFSADLHQKFTAAD